MEHVEEVGEVVLIATKSHVAGGGQHVFWCPSTDRCIIL